jgi:hypothetical protein
MDLKQRIGVCVIDWLHYAKNQGPGRRIYGPAPKDGFWRDTGWRKAVDIVVAEFNDRPWHITELAPNFHSYESRWDHDPKSFFTELKAKLVAARDEMAIAAGERHFHGATGALDCCIQQIHRVGIELCDHQWSEPYTVGGYMEPPEDVHKCRVCGVEEEWRPETEAAP